MKRVYAVIELADRSTFDPSSDEHLDDLLRVAHGVASMAVYPSAEELVSDEPVS